MRQIIYVKYNRTRSEKFQLKTAIVRENGALSVEKTALTEAGAGHMGSFWEKYQMIREQNPRIRFLLPVSGGRDPGRRPGGPDPYGPDPL